MAFKAPHQTEFIGEAYVKTSPYYDAEYLFWEINSALEDSVYDYTKERPSDVDEKVVHKVTIIVEKV